MIHPAACLLAWLMTVVVLQFLPWPTLSILLLILALLGKDVGRRAWLLVRRARWLFLTLWLILAYGTPGEVWHDLPWAPTEAGMEEASLHVLRLAVMLGLLAWLFEALPRVRLMAGLWAVARPLRCFYIDADRLVVRLSLVFDYLEKAPPQGSWRQLLDESRFDDDCGLEGVRIDLPLWRMRDTGILAGTALTLFVALWLS